MNPFGKGHDNGVGSTLHRYSLFVLVFTQQAREIRFQRGGRFFRRRVGDSFRGRRMGICERGVHRRLQRRGRKGRRNGLILPVQDHCKQEDKKDQEQHEQIAQRQKPDFVSGLGGDRSFLKTRREGLPFFFKGIWFWICSGIGRFPDNAFTRLFPWLFHRV